MDQERFETIKNKAIEVQDKQIKTEKILKLLNSMPLESSFQEDLVWYLKRIVISSFALENNFKKVLFGNSAQKISSSLMNAICKGRGKSCAFEISFIDDKNFGGRVMYMNPIRDFLEKEIALYNYVRKVPVFQIRPVPISLHI